MPCIDRNLLHGWLDVVNAERLHPSWRGCVENPPPFNAFPLAAIIVWVLQLQLIRPVQFFLHNTMAGNQRPQPERVKCLCRFFVYGNHAVTFSHPCGYAEGLQTLLSMVERYTAPSSVQQFPFM